MGAAWREIKDGPDFDHILDMVKAIDALGMEVCCTLGMLNESQAKRLDQAGLYAYNHNVDTSRDFYKKIITTRNYDDRINTLKNIRKTKITVCSGGIIGMGESTEDRVKMLMVLFLFQSCILRIEGNKHSLPSMHRFLLIIMNLSGFL